MSGYLDDLIADDKTFLLLFEILQEDPSQIAETEQFLGGIEELAGSANEGLGSLEGLASIIRDNAKWSKDLRAPSREIERALRQMSDTRSVFRTRRRSCPRPPRSAAVKIRSKGSGITKR